MQLSEELKELFERYTSEYTDFIGIKLKDVNQCGVGEDCPLHLASRQGLLNDVNILLACGASVNIKGDIGLTPLHYATAGGYLDIVKSLLKAGAIIDCKDEFGQTPLDWARMQKQIEIVNFLDNQAM
ncbi:MAG: ankyrin repeat domain-containing protein [Gammaproteobacteria bacterium]|nr:MAG: ankyrin repeat domain-containing protein [Gammaproteobacteria bacterium]